MEFVSTTKSYNMAGWRLAFCCGNRQMVNALARIKSYLDYGVFQPIQIAGIVALEGDQKVRGVRSTRCTARRRDILVDGLNKIGWQVEKPKGTMFVWAPIPEAFRAMGSLEFSKMLIQECKVAVSPGHRLRRVRRGPCPLRPRRERAAHQAGAPRPQDPRRPVSSARARKGGGR